MTIRKGDIVNSKNWEERVREYLHFLCVETGGRSVGSEGNQKAAEYIRRAFSSNGWQVQSSRFECVDWEEEGCSLCAGGLAFEAKASPYGRGGKWIAPLICVGSPDELESVSLTGKIVLLHGELTRQQWTPKNFPFYQHEQHQHWIGLLERKSPLAIIAATGRDPQIAGGVYPFPLIEDGDFDIPSVYMTEQEGEKLAEQAGKMVELEIRARRMPSQGNNIRAMLPGKSSRRVVCFAHFDAKIGTPGALDNASGVTILLLLAEMLRGERLNWTVELTALNGEDYYSNPGEVIWLKENQGRFTEIGLGINFDLVGFREGRTAFSLYQLPNPLEAMIRGRFAKFGGLVEGESWVQSDHSLFLIHGVPALAFASEKMADLMQDVIHTERDTPDLIEPDRIVETALAVADLIHHLEGE
ncbi:predicted aminopeptidases [Bellilinea caldifistulae]|nr:predicted aminopeptidases [Bellilinea caldifistulae]